MKKFLKYTIVFWGLMVLVMLALTQTVYLRLSKNSSTYALCDKTAMVENKNRKPSIILLGGSSVAFGFQSKILEDSIGMPVINTGQHAGMGLKFMMDNYFPLLRKGDVVVFSPELGELMYGDGYYGGDEFLTMFYCHLASLKYISARQFRRIIEQTPTFLLPRIWSYNVSDDYRYIRYNRYGDRIDVFKCFPYKHAVAEASGPDNGTQLNEDAIQEVLCWFEKLKDRGVKIVMFPCPGEKVWFKNLVYRNKNVVRIMQQHGYSYPDSIGIELVDAEYIYDTGYHLNKKGSYIHTQRLIKWLKQNGIGTQKHNNQ